MNNTNQLLNDFIQNEFLHDNPRPISVNDNLIEDGVIDSLAILILINFIEGQFSISINPEDVILENFESIGAISNLINRKKGS